MWEDLIKKSTIANFVAGTVVIGGLIYGMVTQNTELILFLTGACVGYLFKAGITATK